MPTKTTAASDIPIGDLIDRAADLKDELVAFAQDPRFARRLDALLFDAADQDGYLDEGQAVLTIDHFALQRRLSEMNRRCRPSNVPGVTGKTSRQRERRISLDNAANQNRSAGS